MKHTFTNTITSLPYGYYLKLEIIALHAGASADTTTTVTNGGYILDIGETEKNVDKSPSKVNLGGMSLKIRDKNAEMSANIRPYDALRIETRLWISYNAGTAWECLFFGFVRLSETRVEVTDTTNTYNHAYSLTCFHALDPLKEIDVDFYTYPPSYVTVASIPVYNTDDQGTPLLQGTLADPKFVLITELLTECVELIPWVTAPASATLVYSQVECQGYNDAVTYIEFDEMCRYYNPPAASPGNVDEDSYFGRNGGSGGGYSARNYAKIIEAECSSLGLIPMPVLINTAGTITFELRLVQRSQSTPVAVTTPPTKLLSEERGAAPYVQGGEIRLSGHPRTYDFTRPATNAGDQIQIEIVHSTSPDIGVDPYLWARSVYQADDQGELQENTNANTTVLYGYTIGGTIIQAYRFRHNTGQAFHDQSGAGYYGVAVSMHNLVLEGSTGVLVGNNEQRIRRYKGMKGATLSDIELTKTMPIGAETFAIEGISRNPLLNEMTLTLVKR